MLPTVLICAAVLAAVALIIRGMVKNKQQGRSPCGCDCGSCGAGCHCGESK